MEGGIVPELRHWQPPAPLVRRVLDSASEVHLHALIHPFTLAVGLRVIGCRVQQFGASAREQLAPEVACEDLVAIGDDGHRNAVQLHHVLPEGARHLLGVEGVAERDKVGELGEAVDDHHDRVVSFGAR